MKLAQAGDWLNDILDIHCAEDWDNVGWMVGPTSEPLQGIMLAVDPSPEALDATIRNDFNLLLTHHPLIFDSLDQLVEGTPVHDTIMRAVKHDVGIYSAHTNVDSMAGGLNDYLADVLQLENTSPIQPHDQVETVGLGRIGELTSPETIESVQKSLSDTLEPTIVEVIGDAGTTVKKLGLCTGSGGDFIGPELNRSVDLYITADVDHHEAMAARQLGLPLIVLDHYEMESCFLPVVTNRLTSDPDREVRFNTFLRDNPYRRTVR